nr:NADH dehydrogenase subunit 5 [Amblyseius tsugawai]
MYFYILFYLFFLLFLMLSLFLFITFIEEKFFILEWSMVNFSFFFDLKIYFYFDYISNIFLMVVSLISSVVFYYSYSYMELDSNKNKFLFLTFLFVFSMFLVVMSMNAIIILVGWDGLGLVSYFLVIHYNSDLSHYSGMVTVLSNRMGDIGIIFMIYFLMYLNSYDLILIDIMDYFYNFGLVFLLLAGFTKSAQFPFSSWLPLAMAAPTPISSLVHSSTLVTAGVYLYIRFSSLFKNNSVILLNLLLVVVLTMFMGGFSALMECDVKKIIAYSTLTQLSLMMIILFMGNEVLAFFHVLTHAMFKSLMFLCSGVFIHESFESQDIRKFHKGMSSNMYIITVYVVCSMSLSGFPFLSGFYSKDLILEMIYSLNFNIFYMFLLFLLTAFTSMYSFRAVKIVFTESANKMNFYLVSVWSSLYSGLVFLFIGVLLTGSVLNWLIMDKLDLVVMKLKVKLISFMLIFIAMFVSGYIKSLRFNHFFKNVFYNMFYLVKIQGVFMNFIYCKSIYYYSHMEYFFDYLMTLKYVSMLKNINLMFISFKFFGALFILLYLLNAFPIYAYEI